MTAFEPAACSVSKGRLTEGAITVAGNGAVGYVSITSDALVCANAGTEVPTPASTMQTLNGNRLVREQSAPRTRAASAVPGTQLVKLPSPEVLQRALY